MCVVYFVHFLPENARNNINISTQLYTMCWICCRNISEETAKAQLIHAAENPDYDEWNTSTVAKIFYMNIGLFGAECRALSYPVMDGFIEYLKTKPMCYMPKTGHERMFYPAVVEKVFVWTKYYTMNYDKANDATATKSEHDDDLTEVKTENACDNCKTEGDVYKTQVVIELHGVIHATKEEALRENWDYWLYTKLTSMNTTDKRMFYGSACVVGAVVGSIVGIGLRMRDHGVKKMNYVY